MNSNTVVMSGPVSPRLGLDADALEALLGEWSPSEMDVLCAKYEAKSSGGAAPFDVTTSAGNVQPCYELMIIDGVTYLYVYAVSTDPETGQLVCIPDLNVSLETTDGEVYWSDNCTKSSTAVVRVPDPLELVGCTIRPD